MAGRTTERSHEMSSSATYKAVLFGPNPMASGVEIDLEYVDGKHQDMVKFEAVEDGSVVMRSYRRGHETEEPVPYRFFEEVDEDSSVQPSVAN